MMIGRWSLYNALKLGYWKLDRKIMAEAVQSAEEMFKDDPNEAFEGLIEFYITICRQHAEGE